MTNGRDDHQLFGVMDLIQNAVITLTDAVGTLCRQLFHTIRAGIQGESSDLGM